MFQASKLKIEIDKGSGFCFGVVKVIDLAEKYLKQYGELYCLGDIVHNNREVERLKKKGLKIINYTTYRQLKNCRVLIRAHGEPPETYRIAENNNIELVDGTCPVVLKLQQKIKQRYELLKPEKGQIVVYGKKGHAEVIGLTGHTENQAIIVESVADLDKVDFSKPVHLFAQTTKSREGYNTIYSEIIKRHNAKASPEIYLHCTNSICAQVSTRAPRLREFCKKHDVIIFVSGKKSSNGKILFEECRKVNTRSHFVSDIDEISEAWFTNATSAGICGATSTPKWLMEEIADQIKKLHEIRTT